MRGGGGVLQWPMPRRPGRSVCINVSACASDGASCDVAADCCSLGCFEGTCSSTAMCATHEDQCSENSNCCSNSCHEGSCKLAGECRPFGEECQSANDCCSRQCGDDARCSRGGKCRGEGEICSDGGDCCNGQCEEGRCAILSECDPVGEPCDTSEECCSRACVDDGTGFKSCQYLGGCRPSGELCRSDSECCNYRAGNDPSDCNAPTSNPGVCKIIDAEAGIGRCDNPGMFAPAGEICEPNSNECCPGNPEGKLYCHLTFYGVNRCLLCKVQGTQCNDGSECCGGNCVDGQCGAPPDADGGGPDACVGDGEECATPDECCGRICVPDSNGVLTCDTGCRPKAGLCTANADCCSGNCLNGSCDDTEVVCTPLGGDCTDSGDCCSALCVDNTCQARRTVR
jgi:hypothetical protein